MMRSAWRPSEKLPYVIVVETPVEGPWKRRVLISPNHGFAVGRSNARIGSWGTRSRGHSRDLTPYVEDSAQAIPVFAVQYHPELRPAALRPTSLHGVHESREKRRCPR